MNIICEECGKHLFNTEKGGGAAGAEAVRKGFIYKLPILYGIEGGHYFCSKECWRNWLIGHTDAETREKGAAASKRLRDAIEESKPDIIKGITKILEKYAKN